MSCMPARIEATHRCRLLMFTCVVVVECSRNSCHMSDGCKHRPPWHTMEMTRMVCNQRCQDMENSEKAQVFQQRGIIDTKLLGFSHAECKSKAASTMCGSGRY